MSVRIDSRMIMSFVGFKASINFEINCLSKFIVFTVSSAARLTEEGMELSIEIAVHYLSKNLLK